MEFFNVFLKNCNGKISSKSSWKLCALTVQALKFILMEQAHQKNGKQKIDCSRGGLTTKIIWSEHLTVHLFHSHSQSQIFKLIPRNLIKGG